MGSLRERKQRTYLPETETRYKLQSQRISLQSSSRYASPKMAALFRTSSKDVLQATVIVAFKIVLTYFSWNIEVKQSNWEYATMPLRPLAASEELSLPLDLEE